MSNRVRFDAPVGTSEERATNKVWPGAWFDATGYAVTYPPAMKRSDYHTGADLNCNAPVWNSDAHAPVYAVCLGFVAAAGILPVWGKVVIVQHALEDGGFIWSRYAHLEKMTVKVGQLVQRGDALGTIGNAEGRQAWHLHFDMAWVDLGKRPGDWPNTNRQRLLRDYVDPLKFIRERHMV